MKNSLLILLLFTGMVKAQIVNIPDANFKARLLQSNTDVSTAYGNGGYMKIDANSDGEIQEVEAQAVDSLNVIGANIANLNGISEFINLKKLDCSSNTLGALDVSALHQLELLICSQAGLTSLNISGMTNLNTVYCNSNQLTSINFTGSPNIESLYCSYNQLVSLDVTSITNLVTLHCNQNQQMTNLNVTGLAHLYTLVTSFNPLMTSIDLSGLTSLNYFECFSNGLTSLHVSGLPNLVTLYCAYNQIPNLDLTDLPSLLYLDCRQNMLTSINVNTLSNLRRLWCSDNALTTIDLTNQLYFNQLECKNNQLTSLFIKNGANEYLDLVGNPNLEFICADESQITAVQNLTGTDVVVNSYCSFVPGGNYNTITGNVKFDINNNGCDATDVVPNNVRLNINDGTTTGAAFTDDNGNYAFYTQAGNFDIEPVIENPTWFTFSPNNATIPFADNNNHSATQNFCVTPNGSHQDLEIVLVPIGSARPGFDAVYELVLHNKGNQFMNDWTGVMLQYDALKMSFVSSSIINSSPGAGVLEWGYFLAPFQTQTIQVVFHINSPIDVNPVVNGDVLNFTAIFNPVSTDENPADNTFVYHQTVVGSYDPNDIICLEGDVAPPTEIGNYLHYTINFENTGTYAAQNVVVKTEVDLSKFDINSLQLMNANFPIDARIVANKAEFIFKNIQLPIGGHGHILLKIKTKNTLVIGNSVSNRGDIFFDYNAPIDTGLASTIFQTLSNTGFEIDSSVTVSPNPASDFVSVQANNLIKSVEIYDVQGRIIQTSIINKNESELNIKQCSSGTYFIKVVTRKGIQVQKIVKK